MTVRELITKWGFEVDHGPLDKVEGQLESIKNRLNLLTAIEVVKGVVELTEKFSKFAEDLHVASAAAGITVEAFQKLSFAAGQNAISQDEMGTAMAKLSRNLYQARNGSAEAQLAFQRAGFSSAQLHGMKDGREALLALADKFKNIKDPIQKAALAQQLMGRGSVNMVGFLSKGGAAIQGYGDEAERLGIILKEKDVNALVDVEHSFQKLWAVIRSVSAFFAAQLAPSIKYVIDVTTKWFGANQKIIQMNIRKFVYEFLYYLGYIIGALFKATHATIEWGEKTWAILVKMVSAIRIWITHFYEAHTTLVKFLATLGGAILIFVSVMAVGRKLTAMWESMRLAIWFIKAAMSETSIAARILTIAQKGLAAATEIWNAVLAANPIGVVILSLLALGVALHDIWEGLHGRPTWINSFMEWLGIADAVNGAFQTAFEWVSKLWDIAKTGGKFAATILQKIEGVGATAQTPSVVTQNQGSSINTSNQVNAPITINVPSGTDHKAVTQGVREGIKDHLDLVHRQAQRSLAGQVAY
jgi:hypothetical protein